MPKSKKKRLNSCNHDFVCLASTTQSKQPTSFEAAELMRGGLGKKQLTLFPPPVPTFKKKTSSRVDYARSFAASLSPPRALFFVHVRYHRYFLFLFIYLISCLVCRVISPFSGLPYRTLAFCASERRLNNTRRHLHMSRAGLYSSATPSIYSLCERVMSVNNLYIRRVVMQEVCLGLNLPAILNLIWPGLPSFICACKHDDFR